MASELSKRRKKREKHVPPEIRDIRRKRENRRLAIAGTLWVIWFGMFIASYFYLGSPVGQWLTHAGFALCLVQLAVSTAAYEWALRKATGRRQVDYTKIHKMEKALRKDTGVRLVSR